MFSHDIRSSGHPRRHHPAGVVSNVNPLKKMNHFPSGLQHSQIVQHSKCTRVQLPKNHNRCFLPSNFLHHPLRSRQPCHGGFGWRWRCNRFRSLQKMVAAASEPNFLQHKCGNRFATSNICLHCTKKNKSNHVISFESHGHQVLCDPVFLHLRFLSWKPKALRLCPK